MIDQRRHYEAEVQYWVRLYGLRTDPETRIDSTAMGYMHQAEKVAEWGVLPDEIPGQMIAVMSSSGLSSREFFEQRYDKLIEHRAERDRRHPTPGEKRTWDLI